MSAESRIWSSRLHSGDVFSWSCQKHLFTQYLIWAAPHLAVKLFISQMSLEHRLSALLQLHLNSRLNTWLQWIAQTKLQDGTRSKKGYGATYIRALTVLTNWIVPHVRMFQTVLMHWRLGEIVNFFEEHIFMLFPERKPLTFFWLIDEACYIGLNWQ